MNFVLLHIGQSAPKHLQYCIKQILKTNPQSKIYLLTNLNIQNEQNLQIINTDSLCVPDIGAYYINDAYSTLWRTSAMRLFYIQDFMKKHNITDIIHFDNDVLIYENISILEEKFKKFNFLITPQFETEYVFGFSFIKSFEVLELINKELLSLLLQGETNLKNLVHTTPHEMRLLNFINTKHNNELIDLLPILPFDQKYFDLFGVCFDPATYGMYIGGSHMNGPHNEKYVKTPEWNGTYIHHYIGKAIINNTIKVKLVDNRPIIVYNNKEYTLVNLHIHSKELNKWM